MQPTMHGSRWVKLSRRRKRNYDRKQNLNHYSTGDVVMLKNYSPSEPGTKKFRNKFNGPYYVIDQLSDIHFRVAADRNGRERIVHHDMMEKMHEREPEDLSWVYEKSRSHRLPKSATLTDVTTTVDDMLRRLKRVENQCGDFSKRTGPARRPRRKRAAQKSPEVTGEDGPVHGTREDYETTLTDSESLPEVNLQGMEQTNRTVNERAPTSRPQKKTTSVQTKAKASVQTKKKTVGKAASTASSKKTPAASKLRQSGKGAKTTKIVREHSSQQSFDKRAQKTTHEPELRRSTRLRKSPRAQ